MTKSVKSFDFTGISPDTGSSSTDFYTSDQTLTVSGTLDLNGNGNPATLSIWATSGTNHILLGNFSVGSDGSVNLDAKSALSDGTWTLQAFNGDHTTHPSSGSLSSQNITVDTVAPTETVPGTQTDHLTPPKDGNLVFSAANHNAITVSDNHTDTLSVTVSVGSGTFTLGSTSGLQSLSGNGTDVVTISGSASAINTALNGSTYHTTSTNQQVGNVDDTLQVSVTDQAGNTSSKSVNIDVTCFMPGTLIRTAAGEVPVEKLEIGDLVLTHEGRSVPVRWIGRQTVSTIFANKDRVLPIRVKAGALAENVPSRDLLVSPDHAILVEGALIQAGALVNGSSILRERNVPRIFTYYHIEVDDHSLILAENTPAETFVDNVDRLGFDNWAEYEALYPEGKHVQELPYPRAKSHRQVPVSTRVTLGARAQAIGAAERSAAA
jgi:hypothetical protein